MSRRRGAADETDPLDLLLDTVSNVFGGVMFLTLLAALLVISRGATQSVPPPTSPAPPTPETTIVARTVTMQLRQTEQALAIQRRVLANLRVGESDIEKTKQIAELDDQISQLKKVSAAAAKENDQLKNELAILHSTQQQTRARIDALEGELKKTSETLDDFKQKGQRSIEFRPLRQSFLDEAVVVLRYGRGYLFRKSAADSSFNTDDFFVVGSGKDNVAITPKPHRGIVVDPASIQRLTDRLRGPFPPSRFKITIAVYDDSFESFNSLIDALTAGGYQYRTIACDAETALTFTQSGPTYVQ